MKVNKIILMLACLAAVGIAVLFLSNQDVSTADVEYVEVVKAKKDISIDQKLKAGDFYLDQILEENFDSTQMFINVNEIVAEGYSNSLIVKDEIIRKKRILPAVIKNYAEGEREITIPTDWISAGGIQKGDRTDLIFYGEVDKQYIGILLYQDILVKSVINRNGQDLYDVEPDKYNAADLEPMAITIIGDQDMAVTISTLSRLNSTSGFTFTKYTQRSEKTDDPTFFVTPGELIGIDSKEEDIQELLDLINGVNEDVETTETNEEAKEGE